jgi:uncharacterized ParB-like nuclease family protein
MRADARIANPTPLSKRPLTPVTDAAALREARLERLDKVGTAVTVQGVVQDTAHVASLAGRSAGRAAVVASEAAAVGRLTPVLSKGFQVAGKWGSVLSVPFAYYDVAKAVMEKDLTARRAAWANAGLTLTGAAMGLASAGARARAGVPLLVGSLAIGTLQLADTFMLKGRVTQWLGDRTAEQWARIRPE